MAKMKQKWNKAAVALLVIPLTIIQPAHSTGIPTFDGAAAMNAIQQLMNWKARFDSLVRDKLTQIPGMKQFLDARRESEIEGLFQRRTAQCERMRKSNPSSADLCASTVSLERQKYQLVKRMNSEITAEFNRINGRITHQGNLAGQKGTIGAISGMVSIQPPSGSGKAESAENDVQAQLAAILPKIKYYENQISTLDSQIAQLQWARKQLTKDQLGGSGLSAGVTKGVTAAALAQRAQNWRSKAREHRQNSAGISNRF